MSLKKIFPVSLTLLGVVITVFYFNYRDTFLNKDLIDLSKELSYATFNYLDLHKNRNLSDKKDLVHYESWIEKNYSIFSEYNSILKKGYSVKFDEKKGFFLFCLNGFDEKESDIIVSPSKELDKKRIFSNDIPSFIKYIFNRSSYDVLLFGYDKPDVPAAASRNK